MLSTPAGSPASSTTSASRYASSGVSGAGFSTTVEPDASAGPSFSMVMNSGTFHGTIAPTTPTGSRRTSAGPSTPWRHSSNAYSRARLGVVVEHHGGREHLAHDRERDRRAHLLGDGRGDLLVARLEEPEIVRHHVGALRGRHLRPRTGVERLARAAATARSTSSFDGLGDLGDDLFGRGEITSSVSFPAGSTQSPPMKSLSRFTISPSLRPRNRSPQRVKEGMAPAVTVPSRADRLGARGELGQGVAVGIDRGRHPFAALAARRSPRRVRACRRARTSRST